MITPRVRALLALALASCATAGSGDGGNALPMQGGDRLVLSAVQVAATDTAMASALYFALQSALQQSSRVRFISPAGISDALVRMRRDAVTTQLPDSIAAEVAEREGARYVISLAVTPEGSARRLTLRVLEPATRLVLRSYQAVDGSDAVLAGIDVVAARLRRDLGDGPTELAQAIPLPRATTASLEALRLLADGRSAFNRARYREARAMYESALALDTGFARARAGLAEVSYVYNDVRDGDAQMRRALALADRLPPRERMLLEANAARGANDWLRAATLHRAYLIRYPDDYDVYALLGYDLMRASESRDALTAYDSLQAHRQLRSNDLINIAVAEYSLGRFREARLAHVAALRFDPDNLTRALQNEQFGRALLAQGFADSARLVHSAMLARDPADQARGHRSLAYVDLYEGRYGSAVAHLRQAGELNHVAAGGALSEVRDRALLASTLIELGQRDAAREQLRLAADLCLSRTMAPQAMFWTGKPLARLGDTTLARHLLDSARVRTRESDAEAQAATLALEAELYMARGQAQAGLTAARRALALRDFPHLSETLAAALEGAGKLDEARSLYVAMADSLPRALEGEGQQAARLAPLAIARLDAQLGRGTDARQALGRFMERWPSADANLPFVTTLRARISAAAP